VGQVTHAHPLTCMHMHMSLQARSLSRRGRSGASYACTPPNLHAYAYELAGKVAVSQRTQWGKLRMHTTRSSAAAEILLETIRNGSPMPFFGEQALYEGTAMADGVGPVSVRAVERTCLICLNAADAASFLQDMPDFGDQMQQRRQVLMQTSMHAVAMQQAIEKHRDDKKHPSRELKEALQLAKLPTVPVNPRFKPVPAATPHPHSAPRLTRGRVAEQAQRMMLNGMEVHRLAMGMGLSNEADEQALANATRAAESGAGAGRPAAKHSEVAGKFLDTLEQLNIARKVLDSETSD